MDLEQLLEAAERAEERLLWEGTFAQYLRMVTEKPELARLSHARVYDMIRSYGVETGPHGEPVYGLFKGQIFGQEASLDRLAQYFASAAKGFEVRKRILLLLGPPASGKSTIVTLLKKGLERYTRDEEGALYAITGCPMQEEPLHLVPEELRPEVEERYGIHIEGELCPRCGYVLRHEYGGRLSQVRVNRVALSERESLGIGTFVSSDPGSQNLSLLVGSVDAGLLGGDRVEVAGRAYRLDGELNVANRGIMEFAEFFKIEEALLRVLLGLAQEQVIKMGRFGSVYADEAIISHSNEGDYTTFIASPRAEALLDRIITVKVPYNLWVSEEQWIYHKMLKESGFRSNGVHLSPIALPLMATFAVLSRLDPPDRQGMSLTDKARLYDEQHVPPYSHDDVVDMQEDHPDEGMHGISPRYVMNKVANVVTERGHGCIFALAALNALWEGVGEHIPLASGDRAQYISLLQEAVKQYEQMARTQVRRAFVEEFERDAMRLFDVYWASVGAYCRDSRMIDPGTGVETAPDEKAMRRLEEGLGITERTKNKFRQEVFDNLSKIETLGQKPTFETDPRLHEGIENLLLPGPKELERTLFPVRRHEVEEERRKAAMLQRLVQMYGYCQECAQDILEYVGFVLHGGQAVRVTRGSRVRWQWRLR